MKQKITAITGKKIGVNTCSYSTDGKYIFGGCQDGSVQIWDPKIKSFHRPEIPLHHAHAGNEVTCVKGFKDGNRFASRAMDDTLKLWDIRLPKHPLYEFPDLLNLNQNTNITISPD